MELRNTMPVAVVIWFGPFPWLAAKRRQGRKRSCSPGWPSLGCIWTQGVNVDSAVGRWGSENCVRPPPAASVHPPQPRSYAQHQVSGVPVPSNGVFPDKEEKAKDRQ